MTRKELIELIGYDYTMLKEKGKQGEEILHYYGFIDGFSLGEQSGRNELKKIV